jgi:hypothetical protein
MYMYTHGYISNSALDTDMQTLSNKLRARAHAKPHILTNFVTHSYFPNKSITAVHFVNIPP